MDSEEFEWLIPTPPLRHHDVGDPLEEHSHSMEEDSHPVEGGIHSMEKSIHLMEENSHPARQDSHPMGQDSFCVQDFGDDSDDNDIIQTDSEGGMKWDRESLHRIDMPARLDCVQIIHDHSIESTVQTECSKSELDSFEDILCSSPMPTDNDAATVDTLSQLHSRIIEEVIRFAKNVVAYTESSNHESMNPQLFGILWAKSSHRSLRKLRQIATLLLAATDICSLLQASKKATKRELYYHHTDIYQSQIVLEKALHRIAGYLGVKLSCLGIQSSSKAMLYGCISLVSKNTLIAASTTSGSALVAPPIELVEDVIISSIDDARIQDATDCILLIFEKEATFQIAMQDYAFMTSQLLPTNLILLTAKGYPCETGRQLVSFLATKYTIRLKTFVVADYDPYGLNIYWQYARSLEHSVGRIAASPQSTGIHFDWLGITLAQLERFAKHTVSCQDSLSKRENALLATLTAIKSSCKTASHRHCTFFRELQNMTIQQCRYETEALYQLDNVQVFTRQFLVPELLQRITIRDGREL